MQICNSDDNKWHKLLIIFSYVYNDIKRYLGKFTSADGKVMNGKQKSLLILGIVMGIVIISACTKEPESGAECFEIYSKGVENYKAIQEISKACAEIFDANKYDDVYYRCLLARLPKDNTDKDVNISIRKCTMKSQE